MDDRHGVEIEFCATCRGVWLDRGELDKIIDRTNAEREAEERERRRDPWSGRKVGRSDFDEEEHGTQVSQKHPRRSVLGEIFDF